MQRSNNFSFGISLFFLSYGAAILCILAFTKNAHITHPNTSSSKTGLGFIYQVYVDRFADEDPSKSLDSSSSDPNSFRGGDIRGIIRNLDYLKNLGVNTLLLSPIILSESSNGLDVIDPMKIDPHYGSLWDFRLLILECHKRQIKILFDLVLSQVSPNSEIPPDLLRDTEHQAVAINDSYHWESRSRQSFGNLRDLKTEEPKTYRYMIEVAKYWIDQGIDGFRIDGASLVEPIVWKRFRRDIKAYAGEGFVLLGALYLKSHQRLNPFLESFDAIPDYFLQQSLIDIYKGQTHPSSLVFAYERRKLFSQNKLDFINFFDHSFDSRFASSISASDQQEKLKQAITLVFTSPGSPMLLYGTESALKNDEGAPLRSPHRAKASMIFPVDDKDPLFRHIQKLSSLRQSIDFAPEGREEISSISMGGLYMTILKDFKQQTVIVIHNISSKDVTAPFNLRSISSIGSGLLYDHLSNESTTVKQGYFVSAFSPYQSRIYSLEKMSSDEIARLQSDEPSKN
jgi:alpha-amylase